MMPSAPLARSLRDLLAAVLHVMQLVHSRDILRYPVKDDPAPRQKEHCQGCLALPRAAGGRQPVVWLPGPQPATPNSNPGVGRI